MQGRTLAGDWQPDGGRILRDGGQATGVFVDGAMDLVRKVMPAPDDAYREQALERALSAAARDGLTGVPDMGLAAGELAVSTLNPEGSKPTLTPEPHARGHRRAPAGPFLARPHP